MQNEDEHLSLGPSLPFDQGVNEDEDGDIEYSAPEDVNHNPQSEVTYQVKVENPSAQPPVITDHQPPHARNIRTKKVSFYSLVFALLLYRL